MKGGTFAKFLLVRILIYYDGYKSIKISENQLECRNNKPKLTFLSLKI